MRKKFLHILLPRCIEKEQPVLEKSQEAEIPYHKTQTKIKDKSLYRNPVVWLTSFVVFVTLLIVVFQIFYRSKARWANEKALPEIEQRINETNYSAAFSLIQEADRYISKNKDLRELADMAMTKVTFLTDPPGAKIFIREYSDSLGKWKKLGTTPIDSIELPKFTFYLTRIEKPGYDDADYMYAQWSQFPPFDRSLLNGFRCVAYINKDKIPPTAFRRIKFSGGERDFSKETPVNDDVFNIYKNQFLYDNTALNSTIEKVDTSNVNWIIEKITFDAAYGNEKVIAYLYLPRNAKPPFQTLIFFPGSYGVLEKELTSSRNSLWFFDYLTKNGRAIMYPVYKGTYERNDGLTLDMHAANPSHQYTEWLIKWSKDLSRSIDYLETRPDIDINKIGFLGHSWGGYIGGIIPAVETRVKVDILVVGGFYVWNKPFPEADMLNYVPRIKIPVLMLNGKFDGVFPLEIAVKPFYNLLGTPETDKRLCVYEFDHFVPKSEMIKETLNFLDKYFGPPGN